MKLVLHTGSRYNDGILIQNWFDQNEAGLKSEGVWYCRIALNGRPVALTSLVAECAELANDPNGVSEKVEIARKKLKAEVEKAQQEGARQLLISCPETGLSRGAKELEVLFRSLFSDIEIIYSVRAQADELTDAILAAPFDTAALYLPCFSDLENHVGAFDHQSALENWCNAFGQDSVKLHVCSKSNIIDFYHQALGLLRGDYFPAQLPLKKLDYRAHAVFELTRPARVENAAFDDGLIKPALFLEDFPIESELTFSRAMVENCQSFYSDSNEALCQRWPGVEPEDLRPDYESYPETGTDQLVGECDVREVFKSFVSRMNAELNFRFAREQLLQGEIMILNNKNWQAKQRLRKANELLNNAVHFWSDLTRRDRIKSQINTLWRKMKP